MQRSTESILTTHTGSLPRPDKLIEQLLAEERGELQHTATLDQDVVEAVESVVKRQLEAGLSVVNDGEIGKVGYATYVNQRLTGYEERHRVQRGPRADSLAFPGYAEWAADRHSPSSTLINRFACTGPVRYIGQAALARDIATLEQATRNTSAADVFMTAASPGVISGFQPNLYYRTNEEYLFALADAMKEEYEAIYRAGFILQLDCPDLTGLVGNPPSDTSYTPGTKPTDIGQRIDALNHAVATIPPERMRLHLCWGNYEGPHQLDTPLEDLLDDVFRARPAGISFEGANPRHEHEWTIFEHTQLPEGKVLVPGVIDSTTNYIEHPDLVAQRIERYANLVGRESVIASTDCGFGTFAVVATVFPSIVFAKLAALADGAERASNVLWR